MSKTPTAAFRKVNPRGRPPTITRELIKLICDSMQTGAYVETAAVINGVGKSILYEWFKKGNKQERGIYRELVDAVQRAIGECEQRDLINITNEAQGRKLVFAKDADGKLILDAEGNPIVEQSFRAPNWTASAWRLERKFPKKWSRVEKIEQTGRDGGPQVIVTLPSNGMEVPVKEDDDDGSPGTD